MALSNVLREPRRELIEQGLGMATVGGFIGLDYLVALLLCKLIAGTTDVHPGDFVGAMIFGAAGIFFAFLLLHVVHWIGEAVCDSMRKRGYDPRPTNRLH